MIFILVTNNGEKLNTYNKRMMSCICFQVRDFVPLGNCSERDSNISTNATTFCSFYENQQELSSVFLYPTGQSVSFIVYSAKTAASWSTAGVSKLFC